MGSADCAFREHGRTCATSMIGGVITEDGIKDQPVPANFPSRNLFGLRVHSINETRLTEIILERAQVGHGFAATYATAHTLAMVRSHEGFRQTVNSLDMCYPDGSGV